MNFSGSGNCLECFLEYLFDLKCVKSRSNRPMGFCLISERLLFVKEIHLDITIGFYASQACEWRYIFTFVNVDWVLRAMSLLSRH